MPDDDFRVVVGRDDRRRAGTRMIIGPSESVGVGSVVLLEAGTAGRERRDRRPRSILGEWVLRADEAGGCDRLVGYGHGRHERADEQTAEESGDQDRGHSS